MLNGSRFVKVDRKAIQRWMDLNAERFRDECGEIDLTAMVEAWDAECSTGSATLNPHHPAWDIAVCAKQVAS
jgi:hypothetical protein